MEQSRISLPVDEATFLDQTARIERLERRLSRERAARLEAEAIAERGLRDLYDSQRWLILLQRITDGANHAADMRAALDMAVREICGHMGWDFGNAYLVEAEGREAAACGSWFAAQPDMLFRFVEASRNARFLIGEGLPGRVLVDGATHWIDDVRTDNNFLRRSIAIDCALSSACAFPVRCGDDIVAVVEFFSRKTLVERDQLVLFMAQIGTQLGRVAERDRARAELVHDALHDSLTGLGNRVLLAERAGSAFARLRQTRDDLAVLVIDLDGFKTVNDRFGHHLGDDLLVATARRLGKALHAFVAAESLATRPAATLARVGGDEFVALMEGMRCDAAERLAASLHAALSEPFLIAQEWIRIGASIGIACSADHHSDFDQIQRDADLAMYAAKAEGRGTTVRFTDALGQATRRRAALDLELRKAIAERQFVLFYQPIMQMSGGRGPAGFEALIRWNHPERGLLPPSEFITQAEESNLIIFIGDWVLEAACTAMSRFHRRLPAEHRPFISINIAPQQFLQPNFVARVREVLMATAIDPTLVRLEVTEGVAIMDAKRTRAVLDEIREWGVRTSLDDFGTGYSSLSYLQSLPFDTLKIDRSFIAAMNSQRGRMIVETILSLARSMDMSVVAEGVESDEQSEMLQAMGCGLAQGYLYGRPCDERTAFALFAAECPTALRQDLK